MVRVFVGRGISAMDQFDFHGRVSDPEAFAQTRLDRVDGGHGIGVVAEPRMQGDHGPFLSDRPCVDVMDFVDLSNVRFKIGFDIGR